LKSKKTIAPASRRPKTKKREDLTGSGTWVKRENLGQISPAEGVNGDGRKSPGTEAGGPCHLSYS